MKFNWKHTHAHTRDNPNSRAPKAHRYALAPLQPIQLRTPRPDVIKYKALVTGSHGS